MSFQGVKRHRPEPATPPAAVPSERSPAVRYSLGSSPLAGMVDALWEPIISCMENVDKHNFIQTSKRYCQIMGRTGMPHLREMHRILNVIVDDIGAKGTPALNDLVLKIRAIMPRTLFGVSPPPRTGIFHPFLTNTQRVLAVMGRVRDIITNRGEVIADPSRISFLPELHESLRSWPTALAFLHHFGKQALDLISPELLSAQKVISDSDREWVLRAAQISPVILKLINPKILHDDKFFARELIGRAACYHQEELKGQASFVRYLAERFKRCNGQTSMESVARVEDVVRDTKEAVSLASLDDDSAVVFSEDYMDGIELGALGPRVESRFKEAYPELHELMTDDSILRFVPPELLEERTFITALCRNRHVRLSFLHELPPQVLSANCWHQLLDQPFEPWEMRGLVGKVRDEAGKFTAGMSDDILTKYIMLLRSYGKRTENGGLIPRGEWAGVLDDLYLGDFPTDSITVKVFCASSTHMQNSMNWLAAVLSKKFSGPALHHLLEPFMPVFDKVIPLALSRHPRSILESPSDPHERLAFVLAFAIRETHDRAGKQKLLMDCLKAEPDFRGIADLFERSFSRVAPLPPSVSSAPPRPLVALASPAAPPPLPLP